MNNLTGYSVGFGFCKELGPVAFIGVPNPNCVQKSGYFEHEVHTYGTSINNDEYYFSEYSNKEAEQIGNYTVYGAENYSRYIEPKIVKEALFYKLGNQRSLSNIGFILCVIFISVAFIACIYFINSKSCIQRLQLKKYSLLKQAN